MRDDDDAKTLLQRAMAMPMGDARLDTLRRAVDIADEDGQLALAFQARQELIETANFLDLDDVVLVEFAWCRQQMRKSPEHFQAFVDEYLWIYKWVINGALHSFAGISQEQIEALLDDMEHDYRFFDRSLRPVWKLRSDAAREFNDEEAAKAYDEKYLAAPSTDLDDCEACECHSQVTTAIGQWEFEKAIEIAEPIIDGRLKCQTVPLNTFTQLIVPLIHLERFDLARTLARRGHRIAKHKHAHALHSHRFIYLWVRLKEWETAIELLEEQAPLVTPQADPYRRLEFWGAATALMEGLRRAGHRSVEIRLPESWEGYRADGVYDPESLRDWFESQADQLIQQLDARHDEPKYESKKTYWMQLALGDSPDPDTEDCEPASGH